MGSSIHAAHSPAHYHLNTLSSLVATCPLPKMLKNSPRLCSIYLKDVVSLLKRDDVHACREVSLHCDFTITRIDHDRVPRHVLGSLSLAVADVSPCFSPPLSSQFPSNYTRWLRTKSRSL